jgi:magnesium transporter
VTDASRKLIGVVSIKTLLLADPGQLLETVMDHHFISVQTLDDQEEIAHLFDRYDLLALPVVDHENRLVGIITVDDALDVIQEESTEDFEKMAAMLPSELPYLDTSIMSHIKQRLPWLLLLMFSATFSELIITYFEDAISVVAALVSFIPMLMDTGGNSGSQSATLVIRGMALGQIAPSDSLRVARKETQVALLVGLALATINMARVLMFNHSLTLAFTVSLSLMATVLMSKLIGSLLPLLAKKLKVDPAIMAAPVITTLVDAGSLAIYFLTARAILHL